MRRFDLAVPTSVDDCLKALAGHGPGVKLVAGGTDLLPQLKNSLLHPALVVDLSGVKELRAFERDAAGGLRIGAAVTARELELSSAPSSSATSPPWAATSVLPRPPRTWRLRSWPWRPRR